LDRAGQTTLELVMAAALATSALAGASLVLRAQWERGRCAHLVFERTRAALSRGSRASSTFAGDVRIREDAEFVRGEGRCGGARESVALRKIEADG
jgi:hypothetical protein